MEVGNLDFELVFKGVVYNEMKGVMSVFISVLYDWLSYFFFFINIYYYNSGGDLEIILDLSYE